MSIKQTKQFDIDLAIDLIRNAVEPFPKAGLFELAKEGFSSPFELLVACIISIQTLDEVMLPTARKFFTFARTPSEVSRLSTVEVDRLIKACTFHERKAEQIFQISQKIMTEYNGNLEAKPEILLSFKGVGPKCANLVVGIVTGEARIAVDTHVHRIVNRWNYVKTTNPEKTLIELEKKLPKKHWIEINQILVPFGKHICRANNPKCNFCPINNMCPETNSSNQSY
jgi:endonuclease-3